MPTETSTATSLVGVVSQVAASAEIVGDDLTLQSALPNFLTFKNYPKFHFGKSAAAKAKRKARMDQKMAPGYYGGSRVKLP